MNRWANFNHYLDRKFGIVNRRWAEVSFVLVPAAFLGGLIIASALNVSLIYVVLAPTLGFIGGAVVTHTLDRRYFIHVPKTRNK